MPAAAALLAASLLALGGCRREAEGDHAVTRAGEGELEIVNAHGVFRYREPDARRESGIGVRIGAGDGGEIRLLEVFADGPARAAGLQAGDELVRIDGRPLAGLAVEEAAGRIRGAPGSAVALEVRRAGGLLPIALRRSPAAMEFTAFPEGVEVRPVPHAQAGAACAAGGRREACHFLLRVGERCYFSCPR